MNTEIIVSNPLQKSKRGRKPQKKISILTGNCQRLTAAINEALNRGDVSLAKNYAVLLSVALKLAARAVEGQAA